MTDYTHFTDQFLIAMPALDDPNFSQTVTYVCAHNDEGAMGVVVNGPMEITLGEVLEQREITPEPMAKVDLERPVYYGGPVQMDRGFVLHTPMGIWDSMLAVTNRIGLATSRDILEAIARGEGPEHYLITLGYAGWGAGQLEQEMSDNSWLSGPATQRILFDLPAEARWREAARQIGIDIDLLTGQAGHA